MKRYQEHVRPPSEIDLEAMTVRDLGEIAEADGVTLLDLLTR